MVYWLLAWWEVILPERSERYRLTGAPPTDDNVAGTMDYRLLDRAIDRIQSTAANRRRQWDEEASQPIKE